MKITCNKGTLITYALGSCIGITFYDPLLQIGALLHIMLPEGSQDSQNNPYRYADLGIKKTVETLYSMGVSHDRIECKIAGGSCMLMSAKHEKLSNIGDRNYKKVEEVLRAYRIPIMGKDVGGSHPRTLSLNVEDGTVMVRSSQRADVIM